ncbi:MAG: N-acetylmuramoyl-L-alanine amidase [Eubacterium sp.]|nr:N-acetylmuramoyl-L-alanine amidase [Eubacterium sp.]
MKRKVRPWKWMLLLLTLLLLLVLGIVITAGIRNIRKGDSSEKREARVTDTVISETAETSDDDTAAEVDDAEVQEEADALSDEGAVSDTGESVVMEADVEPEILEPEEVNIENNGKKIAIDPGHQGKGNSEKEPIGPGASQTKAKVASGTTGRITGVPEYQLNLDVSLKLRDELEVRGYEVYMIRETNDVNISNAERAKAAADAGADLLIRIHANGSENSSVAGALTMSPTSSNPYVDSETVKECQKLSQIVIEAFCEATGAKNQGVYQTDEMSGLNWCSIPATIVELGYMTNPEEDVRMQTASYQDSMVQGIANGIDRYFTSEE